MTESQKKAPEEDPLEPPDPARKKTLGEKVREASLLSAPTIITVYPLVGFGLGYLAYYYLGWPVWVSVITLLLGLIQGIREIYKLSKKIYGDDGP